MKCQVSKDTFTPEKCINIIEKAWYKLGENF